MVQKVNAQKSLFLSHSTLFKKRNLSKEIKKKLKDFLVDNDISKYFKH
jgi:hypothetical protein